MDNPPNEQPQKHSKTAIVAFILSLLAAIVFAVGLLMELKDHYITICLAVALISFILAVATLLRRKNKKHFAVFAIIISTLTIVTILIIAIAVFALFSMFFSLLLGR